MTAVPSRAGAGVIVENGGGAAPLNHGYYVVNGWLATPNGEKIRVFAGGVWNDPLYQVPEPSDVLLFVQSSFTTGRNLYPYTTKPSSPYSRSLRVTISTR